MKLYTTAFEAISDMHENGFTNDFQLFGNDLLWIQEGYFIRGGEFAILEYHKVEPEKNEKKEELLVFGVFLPYHNVKGILLSHCKKNNEKAPPVLLRKINEWNYRNADKKMDIA